MGVDRTGTGATQEEEEWEEWFATVLERKRRKEDGKMDVERRNERGREK